MTNFYGALQTERVTKTEALRQAQVALIEENETIIGDVQRFTLRPWENAPNSRGDNRLSHPYYWAPFILIGNGL